MNILKTIFGAFFISVIGILILLPLKGNEEYAFPFFISVINIGVIFWFLSKQYSRKLIFYIYFIYNILTLKLPLIYFLFFYNNNAINAYYQNRSVSVSDLSYINFYILVFDFFLILLIIFFLKQKSKSRILFLERLNPIKINNKWILLFMVFLAYGAKLYLMDIGVWFFYEMNNIDLTNYPLIGLANNLEKLDILILLYYTYKYKIIGISKSELLFGITILFVSLFFAFLSTSKGKILILIFPVILFIVYSPYRLKGFLILLTTLFFLNTFFKVMNYARLNPTESLINVVKEYDSSKENLNVYESIGKNENVVTRLEYQSILASVVDTYTNNHPSLDYGYFQNLLGLIPRAIWRGKPELGIDGNKVGYEIGVLSKSDNYTSIGITALGTSFYLYGYSGLLILIPLTAFLLIFVARTFNDKYWIGFLLSIFIGIELARNGTYLNILPSLIQVFIVFGSFGLILNNKLFQIKL